MKGRLTIYHLIIGSITRFNFHSQLKHSADQKQTESIQHTGKTIVAFNNEQTVHTIKHNLASMFTLICEMFSAFCFSKSLEIYLCGVYAHFDKRHILFY